MAQYAYATRLSEHIALTPEGFLVCTQVILCRSGVQEYLRSELQLSGRGDDRVAVYRPPEEVLDPVFIASLPGKPVCVGHPVSGLLSSENAAWSAKGTILTAKRGPDIDGEVTLIGDVILTDPDAISRVQNGLREVSVGYTYALKDDPEHGLTMTTFRANHLALVSSGRASIAMIQDAAVPESYESMMKRYHRTSTPAPAPASQRARAFDHDGPLESLNAPENTDPTRVNDESEDFEMTAEQLRDAITAHPMMQRMNKLCDQLEKVLRRKAAGASSEEATDSDLVSTETLPESERPQHPIVDSLRALRPFIEKYGDRAACDAFNSAMLAAKKGVIGPAQNLLAAYDGAGADPRFNVGQYQDEVNKRREEMLNGTPRQGREASASGERRRIAEDQRADGESYEETIARTRRKMLAK
jgi:hypothetical protein